MIVERVRDKILMDDWNVKLLILGSIARILRPPSQNYQPYNYSILIILCVLLFVDFERYIRNTRILRN